MPAVFSREGSKVKEIQLPTIFSTTYDPALIKRAVLAVQSTRIQPFGNKRGSGRNNTAEYIGVRGKPTPHKTINVGHARLPRLRNRRAILYGKVAAVPQAVGGPRPHPPKVETVTEERINVKERRKAIASAIAASMNVKLVKERGHHFDEKMFPLIVDSSFENAAKTNEIVKALSALHVNKDVEMAKDSKRTRAGKNKNRGKRFKTKKSILIVTDGTKPVYRAGRNLPGVEVVQVQSLNAEHLAPGTLAGRLTIWTENAVHALAKKGGH
ncbi:MAG: 50S ribosomal protein L4 [Candidatus Diapherotrites archaeon]|uniref:50S ribosomal protein L4 n=1 Tax=Candidatus Iainarchaeum sp. TaxID=3101447 RepID=A0A8T4C6A6_9ARCH|nr:50S ribosomal protein L4 [Candidatus Diapherotrites archaeon]